MFACRSCIIYMNCWTALLCLVVLCEWFLISGYFIGNRGTLLMKIQFKFYMHTLVWFQTKSIEQCPCTFFSWQSVNCSYVVLLTTKMPSKTLTCTTASLLRTGMQRRRDPATSPEIRTAVGTEASQSSGNSGRPINFWMRFRPFDHEMERSGTLDQKETL